MSLEQVDVEIRCDRCATQNLSQKPKLIGGVARVFEIESGDIVHEVTFRLDRHPASANRKSKLTKYAFDDFETRRFDCRGCGVHRELKAEKLDRRVEDALERGRTTIYI